MAEGVEYRKALIVWRLRRDLEAFKKLYLKFEREGLNRQELREFLAELDGQYEHLRKQLSK